MVRIITQKKQVHYKLPKYILIFIMILAYLPSHATSQEISVNDFPKEDIWLLSADIKGQGLQDEEKRAEAFSINIDDGACNCGFLGISWNDWPCEHNPPGCWVLGKEHDPITGDCANKLVDEYEIVYSAFSGVSGSCSELKSAECESNAKKVIQDMKVNFDGSRVCYDGRWRKCSAANNGDHFYDSTDDKLLYCYNDAWYPFEGNDAENIRAWSEDDVHETLNYKWYPTDQLPTYAGEDLEINPFIFQNLTRASMGENKLRSNLPIFNEEYSLCANHELLCSYMKLEGTSDDLSDYALLFEVSEEFPYITYGDSPRNPYTFGMDDPLVDNLDYRNASIKFCDPDAKSGQFCGNCKLGYDLSNEGKSWDARRFDNVKKECCGDDYLSDQIYDTSIEVKKPDFLYGYIDEPDFSKNFCNNCPLGLKLDEPNTRAWDENAKCCGDDNGYWYKAWNINGTGLLVNGGTDDLNGINNRHDCGKLVLENEYLCNLHRNIETNTSKWYNAKEDPGEIAYIPCIGSTGAEAVSNGFKWVGCGTYNAATDTTHQFNGLKFEEEERIEFSDEWKHSYFCTSPPATPGLDTIYECCGGNICKSDSQTDSDGGIQSPTGYAFNYGSGYNSQTYYCTYQVDTDVYGKEISSQETKSTLWTTNLDFTNKASCESAEDPETHINAGFIWTGKDSFHIIGEDTHNFCCSENDDNVLPYEFYNDPEGIGVCFSSIYQPNKNFVKEENHTYTELYVFNGSIHGCAINDYAAISNHCSGPYGNCTGYKSYILPEYYDADTNKPYDGSFPTGLRNENNFLLDLENWPDRSNLAKQGILVDDYAYCSLIDTPEGETIGKYYCSYEEVWKETEGIELTHLSFTEWMVDSGEEETNTGEEENNTGEEENNTKKRAECCQIDSCWNGNECINSQHANSLVPPFESNSDGYRCIFGEWYYSNLKYNMDKTSSGWCPKNEQCLVKASGAYEEYNNPQCINSKEYVGDYYCENGEWSSRTKLLALQLLSVVKNEQKYTLYCDDYKQTLNTLNYTVFSNVEEYIKNKRKPRSGLPSFNSINNLCILRYGADDNVAIATSLNHPINLDDSSNFLNVFEEQVSCPPQTTGFQKCGSSNIYYNSEINSIIYSRESLSFSPPQSGILIYFQDIFDFIFDWQPTYALDSNYEFLQSTKEFKKVYISNKEQIVAITEMVWPSTNKEYITVKYTGTGADICKAIEAYDTSLGGSDYLQCSESQGNHYIVSGLPEGINLWPQLTSKLRPT